jgi:gamma-glutamyltranspeptidase / glutathione hydrolase
MSPSASAQPEPSQPERLTYPNGRRKLATKTWSAGIEYALPKVRWLLPALLVAALGLSLPSLSVGAAPQLRAVASESQEATLRAMSVLRRGGNAADAAVVAALVAGVTNPNSSGIGGGCFIHFWSAKEQRSVVLDARETAPAALDAEPFEHRPFGPVERGRLVGTPGEVRGLYELHRRFGKLKWSEVVAPAVQVASSGFKVGEHLARSLLTNESELLVDGGLSNQWLAKGAPLKAGVYAKNTRLAATLKRIGQAGPNAFYEGPLAAELVKTVRAAGGTLSAQDLKDYRVQERTPLETEWAGYRVLTMPPPSAGGLMLLETLKLFSKEELAHFGYGTPAYWHALAEAFRGAIGDRMQFIGDPAFTAFDVATLLTEQKMRQRRAQISLERTHTIPRFVQHEHGTHHLVTADSAGNFASLTTTINRPFGSKLLAQQSGVLLNDELDDFTPTAAIKSLGLSDNPNRPRANARPTSSMTPTLVVKDGRVLLAAGGSGGMNIATDVSQMVIAALTFDTPLGELLASPRFQIPLFGASLAIPASTPEEFKRELHLRGERFSEFGTAMSAVQMIRYRDGQLEAAADPRKFGTASAGH